MARPVNVSPHAHKTRVLRDHVFLNVPFDDKYTTLLESLIAGLTAYSLVPRCVLEIEPQQSRLQRLFAIIDECGASIHDLSRVETSGKLKVPRFNMPFELGLAVARGRKDEDYRWFVLESTDYRLQQSLSDLNGFDPLIHRNDPDRVLFAITSAFGVKGRKPSPASLRRHLGDVVKTSQRLRKAHSASTFTKVVFQELVVVSKDLSRQRFGGVP